MLRPETPQAAADAAADVADEVTGDTPDTEETRSRGAAADAIRTGVAPDASRSEPTDPSWEADRKTELDPGRVHGDDLQPDATRSEGEPDE
jgi:hypothetical protein